MERECALNNKTKWVIPELDVDNFQMLHAASSSSLPPLGLNRPIVYFKAKSDELTSMNTMAKLHLDTYSDGVSCWGSHIGHNETSGCGKKNDHNACTGCGFYCAVFRNLTYLSSLQEKKVRTCIQS